jgi:hypothetical protein
MDSVCGVYPGVWSEGAVSIARTDMVMSSGNDYAVLGPTLSGSSSYAPHAHGQHSRCVYRAGAQ